MFKKIRRNFIIIATTSVTLILLILNIAVNVVNFNQQISASDQIIMVIERDLPHVEENKLERADPVVGDSRYFVVTYDDAFNNVDVDLRHVDESLINREKAITYAKDIHSKNESSGYVNIYRYHKSLTKDSYNRLVFLDCQRSMENFAMHFYTIVFSSLGALVVYFLVIFFGSKYILKPVKDSYDKQNRFITNASHELKTPLTIISANNELIEMKNGNSEYSNNINKQVNKLNIMIKDLTALAKLKEIQSISFETINISSVANETIKEFKNVCSENKIKLNSKVERDLTIIGPKQYCKQMLYIILDNAVKYSKSNINFSIKHEKNNVVLREYNDTHENIQDGNLIHYSERFYRAESSRVKKEGSGIGLSLLEEITKLINAKLRIYGEKNRYNIEIVFSSKNKIK